ncbi:hypothetical protein VTK56DRAFT_2470 [Thermocarpiscus australiensis]
MESIQLAQMLADLSDLNATQEPQAAVALVNANKTSTPASDSNRSSEHLQVRPRPRHHQRSGSGGSAGSSASFISRAASPAKFDKYGRRILTPPNTRTNSAYGSVPGTPRRESEAEDDVDRASSLMALYEIRAKLKDQDNRSLIKLREKIAALHAKQTAERKDAAGEGGRMKLSYPKSS